MCRLFFHFKYFNLHLYRIFHLPGGFFSELQAALLDLSFGCPFCMGCPAEEGGGNFLIDGYEILRQLQEDPETRRPVNDVNVEGIKCW